MADKSNDASIRIDGSYGELFVVTRPMRFPNGTPIPGPPVGIRLVECESIQATTERTFNDVNLPGTGETGRKRGPATRNGTLTMQFITPELQAYVKRTQFNDTLGEARAARDSGQRFSPKLVLQVWNDDPQSLGAVGWQLEGVELARLEMGFQQGMISHEHPFAYDDETEIRGFQRIGGQVDAVSGLPAVSYYVGAPAA